MAEIAPGASRRLRRRVLGTWRPAASSHAELDEVEPHLAVLPGRNGRIEEADREVRILTNTATGTSTGRVLPVAWSRAAAAFDTRYGLRVAAAEVSSVGTHEVDARVGRA